jgi:hypothetical protein
VPERRLVSQSFHPACLCLAALACGGGAEGRAAEHRAGAVPPDSLVLSTGTGAEVWFTLVRTATGEGRECVERGLEIRSQAKRTRVPLLYTGASPELLNDTLMRAILWKDCTPGQAYLVNLQTGQPVPERGARKP